MQDDSDSFRWNEWNRDHATKHGCTVAEIERVVLRHFPGRKSGDGKYMVEGRGQGGRFVRVVYVLDDDDRTVYVIHAMPLTTRRRK